MLIKTKTIWFGAVMFCTATSAFGKESGDGSYIAIGLANPSFSYNIDSISTDPNAPVSTMQYAPYIPLAATVEVGYDGYSLGTSFDINGTSVDTSGNSPTGKTKATYKDYAFSKYFDRIGLAASYTSLKGMNLSSVTGVDATALSSSGISERPDITLTSATASIWAAPLAYNFSLSDFYDQASKSRGSGIALVAIASYDNLDEKTGQQLIPKQYSGPFGVDADLMGGNFVSKNIMAGPAVVLDFWGMYVEGLFTQGVGIETATYMTTNRGQQTETNQANQGDFYFAAGYKGDKLYTAFSFQGEGASYYMHTLTLSTIHQEYAWVIGLRL